MARIMGKFLLVFLMVLLPVFGHAADVIYLSGFVRDAFTGSPLRASLTLSDGASYNLVDVAGVDGSYQMRVPPWARSITVRAETYNYSSSLQLITPVAQGAITIINQDFYLIPLAPGPLYSISTPTVTGGSVVCYQSSVPAGATIDCSISPDTTNGYQISSVGGTCGGTRYGNTYITNPIIGNCSIIGNFSIPFSDTTGPALTLSTLANGAITNNPTLNVSGTVSDPSGVASLTVNGAAVTVTNGSFSYPVLLLPGSNAITITAADTLGNMSTDTRTVTLDTAAPILTISTPADNSMTAQPLALVSGTINETSTVVVSTNNGSPQSAAITGNSFSTTVNLSSGINSIAITATDLANNIFNAVRTITYDNTSPSLAITDPPQDITTSLNSITIRGTVSDTITVTKISITFNGQLFTPPVASGTFSQVLTFPAEGTWPVVVTASDEAGNTTSATRNIIYAMPVNGRCGASNGGAMTAAPTLNLCSAGIASIVSGSGPWAWNCFGVNGGATAQCTANVTSFPITATAGSGGSISGPAAVNYGGSAAYTITPNSGYSIATVLVDGFNIGPAGAYTLSNVAAPHTISATFAVKTYTVTLLPGANGTISGPASVNHGDRPTYTIIPATGYHVADVFINGVSAGPITSYTFSTGITADNQVAASFALNSNNGSISTRGLHAVALRADGTVWAWGFNGSGQLWTYSNDLFPAQVNGLTGIRAVAAGSSHSVALKNDGTVWTWGNNWYGQLGDGTTNKSFGQVRGIAGVTAVAAGAYHTVALKNDGTVWTWGYNISGQLGDGTTTGRLAPVQVIGLSGVRAIAAGNYYTVAVKNDGTVWAWGDNAYSQLGDGTTSQRLTPVQVTGLTGISAAAAGDYHSVALKNDGTVWTWGGNWSGQLGDGTTTAHLTPIQVGGLSGVSAIAAGSSHTVVQKGDGTVWAWGDNSYSQLGTRAAEQYLTPTQVPGLIGVSSIAAGGNLTMVVKGDGTVSACGENGFGQLGDGTNSTKLLPGLVSGLNGVTAITAGSDHTAVLKNDHTVWAWGNNNYGQLGDSTTSKKLIPTHVNNLTDITAIAAGSNFTAALKNLGPVWTWGDNYYGQLGDGTNGNKMAPAQVCSLNGVVTKIAAGRSHTVAQMTDGTVWAWGDNYHGKLGDGTDSYKLTPVQVKGLDGVVAVAAGATHSVALKSDGTVWAWGDNFHGQLGDGTTTIYWTPVQVRGLTGVIAIAANDYYTMALKNDGTVWAWGDNSIAQLGDGTTTQRLIPVQVSGLSGVSAIAAGSYHAAALKNDGTVWAWGYNQYGQLGDGTTSWRLTPVQVSGLSGVVAVAAGSDYTVALKNDSTVLTWGNNSYGQLGDGTATQRLTPVQVSGLTGVTAITAGYDYAAALKSNSTVWAWGNNARGQLGDGTTMQRLTPVQVSGLSGVTAIAAGFVHTVALMNDGTVRAWGGNDSGQLGDGSSTQRLTPVQMCSMKGIIAIAAGSAQTVALSNDGTVWAWGNNWSGQLGDGTFNSHSTPVQASGLNGVVAIAAGGSHTAAIKSDGTVWEWGANYNATQNLTPTPMSNLNGVIAVAVGSSHTVALKNDGTVWTWGENSSGQLGDGTTTKRLTPVQVNGLYGVIAIAAGFYHTVALTNDGTVWAWGNNGSGQLGDGTVVQRLTPVQVSGLSGVTAIAAGGGHTVALKNDGTVWTWGNNTSGQLTDTSPAIHQTSINLSHLFISGTPPTAIDQGSYYYFTPVSGGASSFSITNQPAWALFDSSTGVLSGTLFDGYAGTYAGIVISATDGSVTTSLPPFSITAFGKPFIYGVPDSQVIAGNFYSFTPTATNASRFSIFSKPAWASFNTATGTLSGTPTISDVGIYNGIRINALNGGFTEALPQFSITVVQPPTFNISTTAGPNGTISGSATVSFGGVATVTINPFSCYHIADVLVDGVSVGAVTSYTFTNVKAHHSVSATFAVTTYSATLIPGSNGSISGPTSTVCGQMATYSMMPSPGYAVSTVTVNGISKGATSVWATANVTGNMIITATFAINSYTISATAGPNGTISGPATVTYAGSATYAITPATGFHVVDVSVDGVSVGTVTSYTFTNVKAPHTISATFAIDTFTVTRTPGANGTITGPATATYNSSATYAITPNSGYYIAGVTVDGVAVGAVASYTFTNVTANHTIAATFALPPLVVATAALSGALIDTPYSQTLTATGGKAPYSWSISVGALPVGITLSTVGTVNGTTATAGTSSFTVQVTDAVGTTTSALLSITVLGPYPVIVPRVAAGRLYSVSLKEDGTVWAWGVNSAGQVGDGTATQRLAPVQVSGLSGITALSAGDGNTLALKNDGTVWAWGFNGNGNLGDGTTITRLTPLRVGGLTDVIAVAAGVGHSLALKNDGTVWAWGNNSFGQLGDGTTTQRLTPVQATSLSGVTAIAAGSSHTVVLKGDGTVWTLGWNGYGNLGDGTTINRSTPVQVSGLDGIIAIDASTVHTVALKNDGSVWAWGYNGYGQLGDGTTTQRLTPVQVSGLSGITAVSANQNNTVALKNDGTVWALGWNIYGQVGDGTTTQRLTPTQVTGLNGIIAISAGDSHSIALKDNGTIWSWGHNAYGQLGDGTTVNRPVAVQSGTLNLIVVRISGASPTDIPQGSSYTFTPDALGAVSFSITNKPAWALFDPTSGTLSGTPGAADTGTSSGIIITAKNGAYIDSLPAFAITVHGPVAISVTAGSGGTVNGPAGITYGGSVSYSITPETGYHLVDVLVDGSSVGTVTNYTFTNVKAPHTISATFAIDTFTVTRTPGANGTISGPATVNYGDTPTYTILPATGYHVVDVTVDGGTVGAINSYAFGAITANHTISATFAINTYTVTLAAGANGTITGPATATYGSNANYSITPASGYHVVDVLVDGVSTGAVTSYSFANVTANHTISATFAINSYAISASAGTGGTISGPASATYNSSATYAITPNSGYYIAGVTVDGVAVGALTSYTFTSINAAHTIAATFALPPLSVTTTALASATTGKVYSQTLAATGGLASYTWSISNGALPAGLTLSSAGVISGTPTAVATGTFTVQVRDAVGTTATQPLSIVIAAPLKADLTVTAVSGPVTITRGTTRYTFTATVKNQGTAASAAAKVGFYLSTGTTISTTVSKSNSLVGTTVLPALAAGGSSTVTLTVAVPTSAIAAGSYYIGAYADSGNTVSELSETNNGNATAVRVKVR